MAVVEVQRFWVRFKQLNCDDKGFLSKKQIEKGELSRDIFTKNVIKIINYLKLFLIVIFTDNC